MTLRQLTKLPGGQVDVYDKQSCILMAIYNREMKLQTNS